VAGQLGNRIQHALRAYTPRDQKAVRAAAETFRINPKLDVEVAITELKVGRSPGFDPGRGRRADARSSGPSSSRPVPDWGR
jgi:hypothetical protein